MRKNEVSIIIPAWKANEWINDCLQSIYDQTWFQDKNNKWEILLGIDNCEKTRDSVIPRKNTKVIYFQNNYGPYIVRNTLSYNFTKYDNLIFFDSDDLMHPDLIKDCFDINRDLILFEYLLDGKIKHSFGPSFVKKQLLLDFGGYANWSCAADSDFIKRLEKGHGRWFRLNGKSYMYRRMHDDQLTSRPDTGFRSILRNEYRLKTNKKLKTNKLINIPIFGEFEELDSSELLTSQSENINSKEYTKLIKQLLNINVEKFISEDYIVCAISNNIQQINKLKHRLNLIGCEYDIVYVPKKNILKTKPSIILDKLSTYKKPILYVEINSLLNQKPVFNILNFDVGFVEDLKIKLFNITQNSILYLKTWSQLNNIFSKSIELNELNNISWLNQMIVRDKHNQFKLVDLTDYITIY